MKIGQRMIGVMLLLIALVLALAPQTQARPLMQNLLANPGFDAWEGSTASNWYPWDERKDPCKQAPNWDPCAANWWVERDFRGYGLFRSAPSSQAVGQSYTPWHGGVMQTISVAPGTRLRFSVWARAHISNDDLPSPSFGGWNPNFQVGIDPQGKGLWYDPGIVWSAPVNVLDQWVQVSVEATAGASGKVTVFVSARMTNQQPLKHNDAWFDDAELVVVAPAATATPVPTNTPTRPRFQAAFVGETVPDGTAFDGGASLTKTWRVRNTGTDAWPDNTALVFTGGEKMGGPDSLPIGRVAPGEVKEISVNLVAPAAPGDYTGNWALQTGGTRIPGGELWVKIKVTAPAPPTQPPASPTPEATPTPESGQICVLAFHDRNGDTFRQPETEELLPNAVFSVGGATGLVGQYTTDGISEPYCFPGLTAGSYRVSMQPPVGYAASGPSDMMVALAGAARMDVALGAKRGEGPAVRATPGIVLPTPAGGGEQSSFWSQALRGMLSIAGILLLVLAVVIGVVFVLSRRR
ncbi:MAG: NBR1-Ig-like domain-containing protein [Anaerolineae bacterium]